MRACKSCKRIMKEETCPVCNASTTQYCTGYLGVVDPEKSEIAKRRDIVEQGQYALKVR